VAEDATAPDFEELLLRAGFNFNVFLAAAFGFARAQGHDPADFVAWTAERLAPTWAGLNGHGADAVLRLILENLSSAGYPVERYSYGADESTAEIGAIPLGLSHEQWSDLLQPLAVSADEMHALFRIFVPLARTAGCSLELRGVRDQLTLVVRRNSPSSPEQAHP
jgi:hypothetical protein